MRERILQLGISFILSVQAFVAFGVLGLCVQAGAQSTGYISGHVYLQGVSTDFDRSIVGVQIQLRRLGGPTETRYDLLDANGDFLIEVAPASYDVAIKTSHWLRKKVSVTVQSGATATVSVSLKHGDVDGNNEVTSTDLSVLLKNTAPFVVLTSPSKPAPVIVIGVGASASETFAAEEMAAYLKKMTGKTITIVNDSNIPEGRAIIAIGINVLTASIDTSGLNCEQYVIDIQSDKVLIVGGRRAAQPGQGARDAGTLYGVYEFLEGLGIRWYRPEPWGEHVPQKSTISLKMGRTISTLPSYSQYRDIQGAGMSSNREETEDGLEQAAIWQARNRLNSFCPTGNPARDATVSAKLGGQEYYPSQHAYSEIIPPSMYFATHPEYFALVGGQRVTYDLNLGLPELQREFANRLIAKAQANPHLSSLSVEPNDCRGGSCECSLCLAMDLPTNTRPGGQWSNRVSLFSNIVAGMVAQEAPWVKLLWLGYSSHTAAPTNLQQLQPNTIIMPAPIGGLNQWNRSLMSSYNSTLVQTIRDWVALQPSSVMIWEYYDGYGWPGPLPMTHSVAERWRNYRNLGIKGIFNHPVCSWGPQGLDRYMSVKLAWNPDLDVDKELNLYYTNYYGPAAKPMRLYHERLFDAFEASPYLVMSGGRGLHAIVKPALVNELGTYITQAQALVSGRTPYEQRMRGVWAGYEFARRVCELLVLKKQTGVITEIPGTNGQGSYYQSAQAEQAYGDLIRWMRTVNTQEQVFDMSQTYLEDAAQTIFPIGGALAVGSVWLCYLPGDVLRNDAFYYVREEVLLADF